nr:F0F1 ATP synthase subunit epsilon [Bacteroides propionicifaciens]
MKLSILSPEKELFKGEVREVHLPGTKGNFMILNNHAPIISSLHEGVVKYLTTDGVEHTLEIEEGFVEAHNNIISVCVS